MHQPTITDNLLLIQHHIDSWKSLTPSSFEFERLGGLSNQMWKVTTHCPEIRPQAVIFRKFGAHGDLVNREKEGYILKSLAEQGTGPKFYGGTNEYRIEKYYDSNTLTLSDLSETKTKRQMAKAIAELHNVQLSELDKTPRFMKVLEGKCLIKMAEEKVRKSNFSESQAKLIEEIFLLTSEEEISFLKSILPSKSESLVLSHNDVHSQNVLVLKKNKQFMLIDYEYSHYNYRGYDIANFFNEMLFDYNNTEYPYYSVDQSKAPSDEELREFIQYYLLFSKSKLSSTEVELVINEKDYLKEYIEKYDQIDGFKEEVEEILKEVKVCMMFSHYHWILWSVVMSGNEDIMFDYLHYAHRRLEMYRGLKRTLFRRKTPLVRTQS